MTQEKLYKISLTKEEITNISFSLLMTYMDYCIQSKDAKRDIETINRLKTIFFNLKTKFNIFEDKK